MDQKKFAPKGTPASTQKESFTKKMGDRVERAGEKVAHAGATKLGAKISAVGDKIEHSRDAKRNK